MSRAYGEPVHVQARDDGRPVRFVWRGRLYTVRAICEHWVISREWWQDPDGHGAHRADGAQGAHRAHGAHGFEPGQPELEFWRVEAAAGPGMTARVHELRRDTATDAWTLRPGFG